MRKLISSPNKKLTPDNLSTTTSIQSNPVLVIQKNSKERSQKKTKKL